MTALILALSAIITVSATIPYFLGVVRGRIKPRVVSWVNWMLLTGLSGAAALSVRQYPSAVLSFAACLECLSVVIAGLRNGDHEFELFDVACQLGAILGLTLWIIFNDPWVAIIASIMIDLIVSAPTVRHIWRRPHEESASVFVMSGIGAVLALPAIHNPKLIGLVMPLYLILINGFMSSLFVMTPNRRPKRKALA